MPQRKLENSMTQAFVDTASANEMTGLAPTVARDEYEAQSYEEVYPYLPPISPDSDGDVAAVADGIHTEYRTRVTNQKPHGDLK